MRCNVEVNGEIVFPGFIPVIDFEAVATIISQLTMTRLSYSVVDISELTVYRITDLFTARLTRFILAADIASVEEECASMFSTRTGKLL